MPGKPAQNGFVESFNGRMRDELLNETLLFTVRQARSVLARGVDDYNTERPHSSLGFTTPAAFAAELERQRARLPTQQECAEALCGFQTRHFAGPPAATQVNEAAWPVQAQFYRGLALAFGG